MLNAAHPIEAVVRFDITAVDAPAAPEWRANEDVTSLLNLVRDTVPMRRQVVRTGERVYASGDGFSSLHLLNSGFVKLLKTAPDGREQVVALKFRGDLMGFDGMASGRFTCDAIALDTSEVWTIRYEDLLNACVRNTALLVTLNQAMGRELGRERDSHMSICTLPADARVADFLRYWAEALELRGLRCDQISMRLTRAEIGNYLGMTLETVSRALSKLAKANLITFPEKDRRDVRIANLQALTVFVAGCLDTAPAALH
ncbi:fumarate/nitrate reduction transcriptional regulator Fnr [soil metagenome]